MNYGAGSPSGAGNQYLNEASSRHNYEDTEKDFVKQVSNQPMTEIEKIRQKAKLLLDVNSTQDKDIIPDVFLNQAKEILEILGKLENSIGLSPKKREKIINKLKVF